MTNKSELWKNIIIENWDQFDEIIYKMSYRSWLFRGHSDKKWELETSLFRWFEYILKVNKQKPGRQEKRLLRDKHEKLLLERFKANAHLYINHLPPSDNKLEWMSLMQHYGVPTRLLDVTFSPHIAAYFVLESGLSSGCVFAFIHKKYSTLDQNSLEIEDFEGEIFEGHKGENSYFISYEPKMANERLLAQQGLFLIPSTNYETFNSILEPYNLGEEGCVRFIIPARLRQEGIQRLKKMNITSATLFPGIDGFCNSLKYQIYETTVKVGN